MHGNDQADLDGDGKFDGVDISIMEEDRGTRRPSNNSGGGCCVLLLVLGSVLGAGWLSFTNYLIS